jgi:soluble lytic murein transglycosylase-like protein
LLAVGSTAAAGTQSDPVPAPAAPQVYRWVDGDGTVHLTDSPADRRYSKYEPTAGGTGKGINIIARLESRRALARAAGSASGSGRSFAAGRDSTAYDRLIRQMARRYEVPAALIKAVMKAESNFQASAVSRKGAQGLMQLMPATAQDLGVEDAFRAEDNVWGGTRYLREMIDRYGDWRHALAAYNAGPGAVEQYGGIPPYPETEEYVERVLHYYRRYDGDFSR